MQTLCNKSNNGLPESLVRDSRINWVGSQIGQQVSGTTLQHTVSTRTISEIKKPFRPVREGVLGPPQHNKLRRSSRSRLVRHCRDKCEKRDRLYFICSSRLTHSIKDLKKKLRLSYVIISFRRVITDKCGKRGHHVTVAGSTNSGVALPVAAESYKVSPRLPGGAGSYGILGRKDGQCQRWLTENITFFLL